ncbi:MAG: YceI family protein [Pseudomonadota bacterium]
MKTIAFAAAFALISGSVSAADWTLDNEGSRLAFGSVKNEYTGEVHSFDQLSGTVKDGTATVTIDLSSINTLVEIRNERMGEHVFKGAPTAKVSIPLDMTAVEGLAPGESAVVEVDGTLAFLGQDVDVFTEVFVMRVADDKVMVTTNDFLWVATDELGIDAGIDTLKGIAGLDSITRAVPVSIRLMFSSAKSAS